MQADTLAGIVAHAQGVTIHLDRSLAWLIGVFTLAGCAWCVLGLYWIAQDIRAHFGGTVRRWS